jgi:hypothetical protein
MGAIRGDQVHVFGKEQFCMARVYRPNNRPDQGLVGIPRRVARVPRAGLADKRSQDGESAVRME